MTEVIAFLVIAIVVVGFSWAILTIYERPKIGRAKPGARYHCVPCGHDWKGRKPYAPDRCPKCRKREWKDGVVIGRRRRSTTPVPGEHGELLIDGKNEAEA